MAQNHRPKFVVIGGGSGVSTILSELKKVADVTAIVSMMLLAHSQPVQTNDLLSIN